MYSELGFDFDKGPATCQICQKNQGPKYGFYYGKVLSSDSYVSSISGSTQTTTTTTTFKISGRKAVAVCDSCRQKYFWKSLIKELLIAILCSIPLIYVLTIIIWGSGDRTLVFLSIPFLFGPLAYVGLIPLREGVLGEGSEGAGEMVARDLKQAEMKAQGFDKFWTSKEYGKLKTY